MGLLLQVIEIIRFIRSMHQIMMKSDQQIRSPFLVFSEESSLYQTTFSEITKKLVRRVLQEKYQKQFNLFRKIPINFIQYNYKKARITQQYKEALSESSDVQYMRRMYNYCDSKKNTGQAESQQRIKYLTKCLDNESQLRGKISYEYPTMYITGTYKIFIARLKRLKQQIACEISSQPSFSVQKTQKKRQNYPFSDNFSENGFSKKFLEESELESSSNLSDYIYMFSNNRDSINFSDTLYDIYLQKNNENEVNQKNCDFGQEKELSDLICDFKDNEAQNKQRRQLQKDKDLIDDDISEIVKKAKNKKYASAEEEGKYQKNHGRGNKQGGKQFAFAKRKDLVHDIANNGQKSLKYLKKRRIQEKAQKLLEKIKNEESFEFSNKKFNSVK